MNVNTPTSDGNGYVPLNVTATNRLSTAAAVLAVTTAATITFDTGATNIELIPSVSPTAPIFIKYNNQTSPYAQTTASATNFDEVITETKPAIQVGKRPDTVSMSIYSGTAQTVYMIQR